MQNLKSFFGYNVEVDIHENLKKEMETITEKEGVEAIIYNLKKPAYHSEIFKEYNIKPFTLSELFSFLKNKLNVANDWTVFKNIASVDQYDRKWNSFAPDYRNDYPFFDFYIKKDKKLFVMRIVFTSIQREAKYDLFIHPLIDHDQILLNTYIVSKK